MSAPLPLFCKARKESTRSLHGSKLGELITFQNVNLEFQKRTKSTAQIIRKTTSTDSTFNEYSFGCRMQNIWHSGNTDKWSTFGGQMMNCNRVATTGGGSELRVVPRVDMSPVSWPVLRASSRDCHGRAGRLSKTPNRSSSSKHMDTP